MAEKLTSLAKRLRPFINGQVSAIAATGAYMTEGPDIDLVGNRIGRGGDTILLFDSSGAPVAEFAMSAAGFTAALAAATSGDVIVLPAGTIAGNHTIPAGVTVWGFGWNTILTGTITNNGVAMFCRFIGTLTNGDEGAAFYMADLPVAGHDVERVIQLTSEGFSPGSTLAVRGTGQTGLEGGAYLIAQGRYEAVVGLQCTLSTALKQFYRWISISDVFKAQLMNETNATVIRDLLKVDDLGNLTITDGLSIQGHLFFNAIIDGGCVADGVTDDTTAIQNLINSATANGTRSATIYFPPGTYLIGGALQDTGARNGQIVLPNVSTSDPQITIRLIGANRPPFAVHGSLPGPGGYSFLKSSLTGASGTAACISGGNGSYPTQNNISVVIENLITLSPDNPTFTFWNLSTCQGGAIHNLMTTVVTWSTASQPTNSNAYGVKLPQMTQSNYTYVDGLCIGGHYTALLQGELAVIRGLIVGLCVVAIELPECDHASLIVDMHQSACTYGIRATGLHYCDILQYDAEHYHTPAWQVTVYDLDDANNYLFGHIHWAGVAEGVGIDHAFTLNGGANAITHEIGSPEILLDADAATVLDVTKDTIGLDTQAANTVWAGPTSGAANEPTFRALVTADLPQGTSVDLPYGSFSSNATQTIASATTAYAITYTNNEVTNQITLTANSKINILVAGTYLITFSAIGASSAPNKYLDIWLSVDGTNVPRSNTHSEFVGTHNERIITVTYLYDFTAGQYFELYMHSDDTGATLVATAAGTNPTRPESPSIIVTVNKISDANPDSYILLETGDRLLLETGDKLMKE